MIRIRRIPLRVLSLVLAAGCLLGFASHSGRIASGVFDPPDQREVWPASPPSVEVGAAAVLAPDGVEITVDQVVASGFSHPVQVTHAGDGSGRMFVVEQGGRIRVVKNGAVLPAAFLDLSGLTIDSGERGLLGLAFHPAYATNGRFYVNYTRTSDGATIVAEYQVSAGNPDVADPASARAILTIAQPYGNHNGGYVAFGPNDGYLYVGMGDGGSGGDPLNSGQDTNTLLGALLRIDVDAGAPYAVPPDNPFVGTAGRDEIWAYGLRNPWRFSFDRSNGDLYIGDVGQNLWEEVSYQSGATPGGVNLGWRCREGAHDYNFSGDCGSTPLTDPVAEYSHSVGRSITGGFVYRGLNYPSLYGRYFYADYVDGKIWSIVKLSSNPDRWSGPELELDTALTISSFGEDEQGELYVVDRNGGTVRRLADVNGVALPDLSTSRKMNSGPGVDPGDRVTYTIRLVNTGGISPAAIALTDSLPSGITYVPGTFQASRGVADDSGSPTLVWNGLADAVEVTLSYAATVNSGASGTIVNHATVDGAAIQPVTLASAIFVPSSALTTTQNDFFVPGTQPGQIVAPVANSLDCDTCHAAPIYDRWRGSMMSQAGRDPLMWAALFAANVDAPGSGDYCLRCHTPKGWVEGRSHPADGSQLLADDISNGVACALCHRLVDPVPSTSDEAVAIDASVRAALTDPVPQDYLGSSALIVDPLDNRRGPFAFDPALPYHTAYQTDLMNQTGDAATRARVCGTCHNLDNPALSWDGARGQYWPNETDAAAPDFQMGDLFPIERTYDEWLNSAYAQGGIVAAQFAGDRPGGIVETCQDCHLTGVTGVAADSAFDPVTRDCATTGCLPVHYFSGGNTWMPRLLQNSEWRLSPSSESRYLDATAASARSMLSKAASLTVTLTTSGTQQVAIVRVTNETGHKLPTGYPEGRQMWLQLTAYDVDDAAIYESGVYTGDQGRLVRDADIKVYEVRQGLTPELASFLGVPGGEGFHFVLSNTVLKDNRIPPRGYTQAAFDAPGLRPVGATYVDGQHWDETVYEVPAATDRVVAILWYQVASREYIDFLEARGGIDGLALCQLWDGLQSLPEIMAAAWTSGQMYYLPVVMR